MTSSWLVPNSYSPGAITPMVAAPAAMSKAMDLTVPSKYSLTLNIGMPHRVGKRSASMPKRLCAVISHAGDPPRLRAEDEIHRAKQAQPRPQVVKLQRLLHVQHAERHEDREGDDLLHDLQLPDRELGVTDAIGRHHDQVFEQGDAP